MSKRNRQHRSSPQANLARLANKSFSIYRATPLCTFREEDVVKQERRLEKQLCAALRLKRNRNGRELPNDERVTLRSGFKGELHNVSIDFFKFQDWNAPIPAAEIALSILELRSKDVKTYSIVMIPARTKPAGLPDALSFYPLILAKCSVSVAMEVLEWLRSTFDCQISELRIPPSTIETIFDWWCDHLFDLPSTDEERVPGSDPIKKSRKVDIVFSFGHRENLSTATIQIDKDELAAMYGIVRAGRSRMLDVIQEQVFDSTRLKTSYLALQRVGLPLLNISHDGKVKFFPDTPRKQVLHVIDILIALISQPSL